jgi:hypothetical protein
MSGFRAGRSGVERHPDHGHGAETLRGASFDWNAPLWTDGPAPGRGVHSHGNRKWIAGLCIVVVFLWLGGIGTASKAAPVGLYPVPIGEQYGYIDRDGRMVIQPQFSEALGFSEGLAEVGHGGEHGYVDKRVRW